MNNYLIGVYKEVAQNPVVIKIENKKEYIELLLDGEFEEFEYDDYVVLYKKDNKNLLSNIYLNTFSFVGLTIKGNIFIVAKDQLGNFISINRGQFNRVTSMILRQQVSYKNFDEKGRYIPKYLRENNKKKKNKNKQRLLSNDRDLNVDIKKDDTVIILKNIIAVIQNLLNKTTE